MTEAAIDRKHARLAPSAAHRWINCPGSVRLSEAATVVEGRSSIYAAEGTAAHELAAHCLRNGMVPEHFIGTVIDISKTSPGEMFGNRGLTDETRFEVTHEMAGAVREYLDLVYGLLRNAADELEVEQRLDMTHVHPEIFGTGDAVIYWPAEQHLHVPDFKYGKGVIVDAVDNPQGGLYGAGAARRKTNRGIKKVTLYICQPRSPGETTTEWTFDVFDLFDMEADWAEAAIATEDPDAPLKAGDWCQFCPAKAGCPELRKKVQTAAFGEFDDSVMPAPPSVLDMTADDLAAVLLQADMINGWIKAVQEHAHKQATEGNMPTGFKLVDKRAMRKWKDESDAEDAILIDLGLSLADAMVEPKLKSPAQIEAIAGKKAFAEIAAENVVKKSSGTNLVPLSDKRPAAKADAETEFNQDGDS